MPAVAAAVSQKTMVRQTRRTSSRLAQLRLPRLRRRHAPSLRRCNTSANANNANSVSVVLAAVRRHDRRTQTRTIAIRTLKHHNQHTTTTNSRMRATRS
jgi:hypothetical protein